MPENLLSAIIADMSRSQIPYCLLRNYESLPETIDGDVDILLEPESLTPCLTIIKSRCEDVGAFPVFFMRLSTHVQIQIYIPHAETNARILAIDLQTGLAYKNIAYFTAKNILENLDEYEGYSVPKPAFEIFCLIAHCVIDKNRFKEKYKTRIIQLLNFGVEDDLVIILTKAFGNRIAGRLMDGLKSADLNACLQHRSQILIRFIGITACSGLASYAWELNRHRIQRLLRFPGIFAVLLGPDGSGKSTVADALVRALAIYPVETRAIYLGSKKQTLPQVLKNSLGLVAPKPVSGSCRKTARDFMAIAYHCARYALTYWLEIVPSIFRRGIVVGDRYYYDLFVSGYYTVPEWFVSLCLNIMPNPDAVFFLENTPEVIFQRKPEISPSQIRDQLERFRTIGAKVSTWQTISTDAEISAIVGKMLDLMMEKWKLPWASIK